jgi:hypothetical protein
MTARMKVDRGNKDTTVDVIRMNGGGDPTSQAEALQNPLTVVCAAFETSTSTQRKYCCTGGLVGDRGLGTA